MIGRRHFLIASAAGLAGCGLVPDVNPIRVTVRDEGHIVTVRTVGHRVTARDGGHRITAR
jgi:hypothetical protein